MDEVFDSVNVNAEYRKDDDIVLVVLKGKAVRDDFRTPLMHAADMVMRHSCKVLVIDFRTDIEPDEADIKWCQKILVPNLKKNGLETLVFIDNGNIGRLKEGASLFEGKIDTKVCKDIEEVRSLTGSAASKADGEAGDQKTVNMTREEALIYMGLEADADIKEIDDRFWQMSKKYRGKTDPESIAKEDEISAVYDIASGRRDRRAAEEIRRSTEPKYFGRYKSDWKNIIHYNWKNWILWAVIAVSAIAITIGFITNTKSDCSVIFFGHMDFDNTYVREVLEAQEIRKPYVGSVNIVVPNDQEIPQEEYGNEMFNAQFYTDPDVLVSDSRSYKFYFNAFKDLTPLYDRIMEGLSDEAKASVEPVYMSERDAVKYQNIMNTLNGIIDIEDMDPDMFPDTPVMIGIELKDPEKVKRLGVDCWWKERETTLVFGQCVNSTNDDQTVLVITTIINSAFE